MANVGLLAQQRKMVTAASRHSMENSEAKLRANTVRLDVLAYRAQEKLNINVPEAHLGTAMANVGLHALTIQTAAANANFVRTCRHASRTLERLHTVALQATLGIAMANVGLVAQQWMVVKTTRRPFLNPTQRHLAFPCLWAQAESSLAQS